MNSLNIIYSFKTNKLYPLNKVNKLNLFRRNTIFPSIVPSCIILLNTNSSYYSIQHKTISRASVTMTWVILGSGLLLSAPSLHI